MWQDTCSSLWCSIVGPSGTASRAREAPLGYGLGQLPVSTGTVQPPPPLVAVDRMCRQRDVGKADSHPLPRFSSDILTYNDDTLHCVQHSPHAFHHLYTAPPTTPSLPLPANSTKCLSVLSIPAARSSAAPHAISMTAPNAAQWCVREDERLPLRMALERNVHIARLEGPCTVSPPFAITRLVIDPIFQV